MGTQRADRGPNPDLQSAKVGPRLAIGPKFGPSHFSGREVTVCLMHAVRTNPFEIAVKTFFIFDYLFFGLQSHFGRQIAVKNFFILTGLKRTFGLHIFWTFSKFSQSFLDPTTFHLPHLC